MRWRATAVAALHVCFLSGSALTLQEKLATVALFMALVGGLLYASVYRGEGDDGPSPPGDDSPEAPDDPRGDPAYPWWPDFERELRDYERQRERIGV